MPKTAITVHKGSVAKTSPGRFDDPVTIGANGSILINTSKLGAPDNIYDADYSWLSVRHGAVSLWFAKENVEAPDRLRSRLELRYPAEGFVRHFWDNSREFHAKLEEALKLFPTPPQLAEVDVTSLPADRDASMWVNFDYLARAGTEAALDFFHLPPSGIARFAQGQGSAGLILTAKVRVLTTIHELSRLLHSAGTIVDDVKKTLPGDFVQAAEEKA